MENTHNSLVTFLEGYNVFIEQDVFEDNEELITVICYRQLSYLLKKKERD